MRSKKTAMHTQQIGVIQSVVLFYSMKVDKVAPPLCSVPKFQNKINTGYNIQDVSKEAGGYKKNHNFLNQLVIIKVKHEKLRNL